MCREVCFSSFPEHVFCTGAKMLKQPFWIHVSGDHWTLCPLHRYHLHNIRTLGFICYRCAFMKVTFKRPAYNNFPPLQSPSPIRTALLYRSEMSLTPFMTALTSVCIPNSRGLRAYCTHVPFPKGTSCSKIK